MGQFKFLVMAAGFAVSCGCSPKPGDVAEIRGVPASLLEASDLLRGGANGRPATQLADLEKNKHLFPSGYRAIKDGDIIVLWGVPPKGEGAVEKGEKQDIIAYEKKVPAEGGWVLFSGGTPKKMTAAEFAAAPKTGTPSH